MTTRRIVAAVSVAVLAAAPAMAQDTLGALPFNWKLLDGTWAESARNKFACDPSNLHFQLAVSADRKRLTFKLDRKWKIGTGKEVTEYEAEIRSAEGRVMVIRYGRDLGDLAPEMSEWELMFIGPGVYRWRSTSWEVGQYNNVIGVKCGP